MGMEGLGRLFNVVPIASTIALNTTQCASVTFVCTGDDTFTLYVGTSFGTLNTAPATTAIGGGMIRNYYTTAAQTNGSIAWSKTALASGSYVNAVTIASGTVAFTVYMDDMSPQTSSGTAYTYLQCSASSAGLVTAILHDLEVQRAPANLLIPGV